MNKGQLVTCSVGLLAMIFLSFNAGAQRRAIELCPGAGVSINSNPGSNMYYKGDGLSFNYSALFSGVYNVHRSMSAGLEFRVAELSRKHDGIYNTYTGAVIGGGKKFVYAKAAMSVCAIFNGKLNTYRGYVYGGAAGGYGFSNHNSAKLGNNEAYRTPAGGSGPVLGVQIGYTHGLTSILGLNVEGALRNYTLNYDAGAPEVIPYTDLRYNITAYTVTLGLKVRIMPKYKPENAIPAQRGKGRSRTK